MPRYQRPAAPVATNYPGSSARTPAAAPGARSAADVPWRNVFTDERLRQLIELALANNRDLRVAMLNVAQVQAQYRITRSASLPSVDGSGGYSRQYGGGTTTSQWSANVGASAYELDLFGRIRSLNAQALQQYLATEEAQRAAQVSLVGSVATQYFTLRETEEQLALARDTLVSVQRSYDLNKATFDAGASNELDLRTAEGQVLSAQLNVSAYERQLAQATNALTLLVGETLPANLPAPRPFDDPHLLGEIPAGLPSDLVQRRPDILEAEHTLQAANANIGAARAAFFPSITLTGAVGTASSQLSSLFSAGSGNWNFSTNLNVPIFNYGRNRAQLDVARIATRIDVANYEKAIQTAFREVADALVGSSSYTYQITTDTALIATQQRRFELATIRYRQGADTYLNVLSAQQSLYSAQQDLLQARYNKLASGISLYQALGGGWQ